MWTVPISSLLLDSNHDSKSNKLAQRFQSSRIHPCLCSQVFKVHLRGYMWLDPHELGPRKADMVASLTRSGETASL